METTRAKYDQLIQDLRGELRPQREWCEGRGLFMVIGHFVVGVAGGTWLFSLLYGNRTGLALASAFGDFFMKYSTIRAGVYLPVWTRLAPQR